MTAAVRVEPLTTARLAAFRALFEASGSACFCRYWHFPGDKNAWLARSADGGAASLDEQAADLEAGRPEAFGLLAFDAANGDGDGAVLGWIKVGPRTAVPKLRGLSVYRRVPRDDADGAWAIGCLLVAPGARGRGVARALVEGAVAHAAQAGATALEAYPRSSASRLHDEEAWLGPDALYRTLGFAPVGGEPPYELLRLPLAHR